MSNEAPKRPLGLRLPGVLALLVGIAALSTIAIPMWFGQAKVTLTNAADLLVRDLEELRQRATYLFADVRIDFEENGDGYTLKDSFGTELSAPVGPGPYLRRYARDAVFRGVSITRLEIGSGEDRILRVDSRGAFLDSATIELAFEDERITVLVDAPNGIIQVDGETRDLVVFGD